MQIGIMLVSIATGAFGEARLTRSVAALVVRVPALAPYSDTLATVLVVGLITYLSAVVGELLPKRVGLATPAIWLLNASNNALF